MGRSILLGLLGVPMPVLILIDFLSHEARAQIRRGSPSALLHAGLVHK